MSEYLILPKARLDLAIIYAYTVENFGIIQAKKYNELLYKNFDLVVDMPTIGNQNHMSKTQVKNKFYKVTVGKHYIFYKQNKNTENIDIVGLVHVSRDIKRALSSQQLQTRTTPKKQQNKGKNKSRGR